MNICRSRGHGTKNKGGSATHQQKRYEAQRWPTFQKARGVSEARRAPGHAHTASAGWAPSQMGTLRHTHHAW
jgi:hypothetical protein